VSREQWQDIAFKGVLAAVFFFVLKHYVVLNSSLENSLFWGVAMGMGASLLAWSQHNRTRR
jgi:hypothetical protein